MRVQFTVTNDEWKKLQNDASLKGYPDVSSYCKDFVLQERTYGQMWETVTEKISRMKPGKKFSLNELVDVPPANLGVKLYNNREALGIEKLGKTNGSNKFIKL